MKNKKDYSIENNVNTTYTNLNHQNIILNNNTSGETSGDFSNKAFKSFIKDNVHRPKVPLNLIESIKNKIK